MYPIQSNKKFRFWIVFEYKKNFVIHSYTKILFKFHDCEPYFKRVISSTVIWAFPILPNCFIFVDQMYPFVKVSTITSVRNDSMNKGGWILMLGFNSASVLASFIASHFSWQGATMMLTTAWVWILKSSVRWRTI